MKYLLHLCLLVLVLLPTLASAQATTYDVIVSDVQTNGRTVSMKLRVVDQSTKQEVANIAPDQITIFQDGSELRDTQVQLTATSTDAFNHDRDNIAFDSSQNLTASGATVGVVLDLSVALNKGAPAGTDYVKEARDAAELWINQGTDIATQDPEQIGLFIPLANNSQALQPEAVKGFQYDHNLVIERIRNEAAREGATDLYDAMLAAIEQTAATAKQRGTPAYVVVFSDGTVSGDSEAKAGLVLSKAEANNVTIVAFGIGNPTSLERDSNRLPHIAPATGGEYIQTPLDQREAKIADVYKQYIKPVDRTGYDLAFVHTAPVDNQEHTFQVHVTLGGQEWSSTVRAIPPDGAGISADPSAIPLASLQQWYLLRAIPLAIILTALATGLATLSKRTNRNLSVAANDDMTKTRT